MKEGRVDLFLSRFRSGLLNFYFLGISTAAEWEKVTREQLVELGGVKLLKMRPSISRLLLSSFPSMEILPWKFAFVPKVC